MKQLFLDVETSGLDENKHGIWQLAAKMYVDSVEQKSLVIECDIFPFQEWHEVARGMCPIEDFSTKHEAKKGFGIFKRFLKEYIDPYDTNDKAFLYAYNATFDEDFLRKFFYNNNDKYFGSWFINPVIDIMSLAGEELREVRFEMDNFKQATVAKQLGIPVEEEKLHDALYDVELARSIYQKVTGGII